MGRIISACLVVLPLLNPARSAELELDVSTTYRAADGASIALAAPKGGALVLFFYSTECPISNYYSPTMSEIVTQHKDGRVRVVGVCVDPRLSSSAQWKHAQEFRLNFPVIRDPLGALARSLGVTVTPEVVLIDSANQTRYQGRIDDQYAERRVKTTTPRTHELLESIEAVLAGQAVAVSHVAAVGCPLPEVAKSGTNAPTYTRDVAPILARHCVECHRPGQIGPFALETFAQASQRAEDLSHVTSERLMPPWRAKPGFGPAFKHDRSLTSDELATLAAWADAGAPEGDRADAQPAPSFDSDWKLGTPDLVIEMPEAFAVPATGSDIYRCFVIPTNLPSDVYVAGVEYHPGNARVVHHILGYVDISGEAAKLDSEESGPGYTCFGGPKAAVHNDLGGWAPGAEPGLLPDGVGRSLPKGGHVVLQVHYHPNGKPETDRSRVGLFFAKKPVKQTFHWAYVNPDELKLPAGEKNIEIRAEREMPLDVVAYAVSPHMHMLGTDMTMWAELPDGKRVDLIEIDRWDFQWQNQFYFVDPMTLPKGSVVKLVAHFDNSSENPRNPNRAKPVDVSWGEATTDEMCIGFIGLAKADQDLTRPGDKDDLSSILAESNERPRRKRRR